MWNLQWYYQKEENVKNHHKKREITQEEKEILRKALYCEENSITINEDGTIGFEGEVIGISIPVPVHIHEF